jgi:multicomponent K+:H+ antiporter subunit E
MKRRPHLRLLPHPLLTALLAAIWLLLTGSLAPGQVVLALLLGWAIPLFTRGFWPETVRIRRPLALARFTVTVVYDIVVANLSVARLILGRPQRLRPAVVRVPLALESELAVSLLANTVSHTPGTVSARLSADRRTLLVHALHAPDPDAVAATIKARYEAPLKEIFEC